MKFKLGDFVRFVDERREGYITRVISDQMVGVTGEDDFEIPVLVTKITLIHGSHLDDEEERREIKTPAAVEGPVVTRGVYLAITEDPRVKAVIHLHIVNETSLSLLFNTILERQKKYKGDYMGIIEPGTVVKIHSLSMTELDNWPTFHFQALFNTPADLKPQAPLVNSLRLKAKDFSSAKKPVNLLETPAWLFRIDEAEVVIDPEKLKESFFKSEDEKIIIDKPSKEVDLHIEKLRDDHQFLSNTEILKVQLEQFHRSLDAAIVHHLPSIVFIHGVGNGTLKHELYKVLSKHTHVRTFMDAKKEKFGYGATEVILK